MFNYINQELFDDMLDMPKFYLYNEEEMKNFFEFGDNFEFEGFVSKFWEHYFIGLKDDLTKQNYFDTLVHEMIHMHLIEKSGYTGHGKPFIKMCEKAIDILYWRIL